MLLQGFHEESLNLFSCQNGVQFRDNVTPFRELNHISGLFFWWLRY